uniref:hypothetical protein n=1 Tax=Bacillus altitudinis TaxID=293387 RepID=UPI001C92F4ED
ERMRMIETKMRSKGMRKIGYLNGVKLNMGCLMFKCVREKRRMGMRRRRMGRMRWIVVEGGG